ncbi:chemotaxis protein CheB [Roseovarius sp. MMSF_3305]|uniref:chemotaxis protein CheB n=2 Tax=unclassified Roseovarius TaxID=2614913 RepID=UPI00273F14BD|nr:chemotaxis protein CheB [Roseovarius sp. MMSF_3305]
MTHPMICIGGSSGSIEVLHDILAGLPKTFPAPVTIVLHRHRDSQETLLRLLRSPGMPAIIEPYDKEVLSSGAVYLAPPNYHMLVDGTAISLSVDPPIRHARPSIDVLFGSVARSYGPRCIVIILSGANSDGARGAACIHRRGGRVLVQDPATAASPVMPQNTLQHVPTARVLSPAEIGAYLLKFLAPERPT